jgi:gas vesicle protein
MGMILAGIVIVLVVSAIVYLVSRLDNYDNEDALIGAGIGSIVSGGIVGVILIASIAGSYTSYVDIRTKYDATITQYKEAVTMYKGHATIDVKKAALTDLKYQGYQENMASFIKNLRREVTKYNEVLISKRIMKKNWFFNWIIIAPDDDMKILNMSD